MTSASAYAEVIGDPIAHSKSPAIHGFWLGKLGLGFAYRATQVTRAGLAAFVEERRRERDWRGCNVTMPLKLDAVMLADEASDRALAAKAANLLVPRDGILLAGNTDVGGVLHLLGPILQVGGGNDGVTLLGNGGAARAALVALKMLGQEDICIQARDLTAAYALALEFGLEVQPRPFDAPVETGGLINATPLGMARVPPFAIDIHAMPASGWVLDMVTDPIDTPLLSAARAAGLRVIDGLALLVEQASESFRLLFDAEAPRQYDAELMQLLRAS